MMPSLVIESVTQTNWLAIKSTRNKRLSARTGQLPNHPSTHPSTHLPNYPPTHAPTNPPTHLPTLPWNSSSTHSSSFIETHTAFIIDNKQRILNPYFQDHTRSLASATHEERYHVSLLCGPCIIPLLCHSLYRSGCSCACGMRESPYATLGHPMLPYGLLNCLGFSPLCPPFECLAGCNDVNGIMVTSINGN